MSENILFLVKQIGDRARVLANYELRAQDLTMSQIQVLICIEKLGGKVTQKQIARALGVSHPTVVGIVQRLERHGFVSLMTDQRDRRSKLVELTEKNKEIKEVCDQNRREMEKRVLQDLSEEEKKELRRLLLQINQGLRAQLEKTGIGGNENYDQDIIKKCSRV